MRRSLIIKASNRGIDQRAKVDASDLELKDKLISIDRVTKVVKGGKHMRFRASVVVGDGNGHVGLGLAKASGVPEAIRKAGAMARKGLVEVSIVNGTIPHGILAKFGTSKVLLKPAMPGTGLVASNTIAAVLELAGIKDILSKSLGSSNKINVIRATILALASFKKTAIASKPLQKQKNEAE